MKGLMKSSLGHVRAAPDESGKPIFDFSMRAYWLVAGGVILSIMTAVGGVNMWLARSERFEVPQKLAEAPKLSSATLKALQAPTRANEALAHLKSRREAMQK